MLLNNTEYEHGDHANIWDGCDNSTTLSSTIMCGESLKKSATSVKDFFVACKLTC
jgi:hypothetical protein